MDSRHVATMATTTHDGQFFFCFSLFYFISLLLTFFRKILYNQASWPNSPYLHQRVRNGSTTTMMHPTTTQTAALAGAQDARPDMLYIYIYIYLFF